MMRGIAGSQVTLCGEWCLSSLCTFHTESPDWLPAIPLVIMQTGRVILEEGTWRSWLIMLSRLRLAVYFQLCLLDGMEKGRAMAQLRYSAMLIIMMTKRKVRPRHITLPAVFTWWQKVRTKTQITLSACLCIPMTGRNRGPIQIRLHFQLYLC